jgi:hypothetical protein
MVLHTDDKANEALVEKFEISWNGLIIDKGGNVINITEQANSRLPSYCKTLAECGSE